MTQPVVLCILDGWGIGEKTDYNAIHRGKTPTIDRLDAARPFVAVEASGEGVGLPDGQMGNSEVGHLNIGAGRVVYQDIMRIYKAIRDGSLADNPNLSAAMERAAHRGTFLHLLGLVSDGGVHSHIDHLTALVAMAKAKGVAPEKILIHAITDGRDTPPDSGAAFIARLEASLAALGAGRIATVCGRFYAMDRDKRWDRVEAAFALYARGEGRPFAAAAAAVVDSYARDVGDEFVEPSVVVENGAPIGIMGGDDEIIAFNFRADRMREIIPALFDPAFAEFDRKGASPLSITTMTEYKETFDLPVAFDSHPPKNGLGEVLAAAGKKQLRTAETEKYAHVTFFFNGGVETPNAGEERQLVSSPRVRTYDLKPEMSCPEVTDGVVAAIASGAYDLIVVNLANGDMVGHTGVWEAALQAVATIDEAVDRIIAAAEKVDAHLLITADHGNIEKMVEHGKPMTAHTTNPVPFYYVGTAPVKLREGGKLADVAPTILTLMGIDIPPEMTGASLLVPATQSS